MWKTIENSFFWLTYSHKRKEVILRFLNPLSTRVRVFKVSFSQEVINLLGPDTYSENIMRLQKRKTAVLKELTFCIPKLKPKLEEELLEINNKLQEARRAANLY
jgi:hypothetical protein